MRELQLLRWAISSKLTEFAFLPGSLGRGWQKRRHVAGNFYSEEVSEAVSHWLSVWTSCRACFFCGTVATPFQLL
jgi:hypothetical protein